ncbi:MAG: hypothetical protein CMJ46_05440, partial [Planctomyces sp.]|nr:hypothetical protein [Planctomyces sp.]
MRALLQMKFPDGRMMTLDVSCQQICLGRDSNCEIEVNGELFPKVSRRHALIVPAKDGFEIRHLSQSNHTLLNHEILAARTSIKEGDTIRLGVTGPEFTILELNHREAEFDFRRF